MNERVAFLVERFDYWHDRFQRDKVIVPGSWALDEIILSRFLEGVSYKELEEFVNHLAVNDPISLSDWNRSQDSATFRTTKPGREELARIIDKKLKEPIKKVEVIKEIEI